MAAERMRAAVLHGRGDLRIEEVPVPRPAEGEVLLGVTAVGVCGTDAAEWARGPKLMPIAQRHPITGHLGPMIMGHEFAGRVLDVGEGVDTGWIGRLVASCGAGPCGICELCTTGRSNVCPRYWSVGLHRDGALAPYAVAPVRSCVDVGVLGLGEHEAALVQPMSIAVHAARRSGAAAGETAVVQGIGGVGAFLVHVLVQSGVRVIAADLDVERLGIARELGADAIVPAGKADTAARLEQLWGEAPPVFFEVSGSAAGMRLAVEMLPMGSRIVAVGIAKEPYELDMGRVTVRELSLIGTNAMVRETDLDEAARLVAVRRSGWAIIASDPIAAEDLVERALRPISQGRPPAVKTLVLPPG